MTDPRLCLALDMTQRERLLDMARATSPHVSVFKIGVTAVYALGPDIVADLAPLGDVFVDAKLHDIPAQVAGAIEGIGSTGATFVTVHASGGFDMMKAAVAASPTGLGVLAVTVLTSLDDAELALLGIATPAGDAVMRLAERALDAGVTGLVCSPLEVDALRRRFGPRERGGPLLVVPGIRPSGRPEGDQRRTASARAAIAAGADLIVIGRPITEAADPAAAAATLAASLDRDEP